MEAKNVPQKYPRKGEVMCHNPQCRRYIPTTQKTGQLICCHCNEETCLTCLAMHKDMTCTEYILDVVRRIDTGSDIPPEEKRRRFEEELSLYEQDIVYNKEEFECGICFTNTIPGEGVLLKSCHHKFCCMCLRQHIKNTETVAVNCPSHDGRSLCNMEILDGEIRSLIDPMERMNRLEQSLVEAERTSENAFHCPTEYCNGWCFYDPGVTEFPCPCCNTRSCIQCGSSIVQLGQCLCRRQRDNQRAEEQSVSFLENALQKREGRRCSNCRMILFKISGCNHVVCGSCKRELDWDKLLIG